MIEKISVTDNNNSINYDFIASFKEMNNDILLMTKNEYDENGNIKLICSKINNNILIRIDDDLWTNVKNTMRNIISSTTSDYNFIKLINKSFESSENYIRSIGLKVSEKDKIVHDYNEFNVEEEIPIPVLNNLNTTIDDNNVEDVEELDLIPESSVEELDTVPEDNVVKMAENNTISDSVKNVEMLEQNANNNSEKVYNNPPDSVVNIDTVPLYENVKQEQEQEEVEKLDI